MSNKTFLIQTELLSRNFHHRMQRKCKKKVQKGHAICCHSTDARCDQYAGKICVAFRISDRIVPSQLHCIGSEFVLPFAQLFFGRFVGMRAVCVTCRCWLPLRCPFRIDRKKVFNSIAAAAMATTTENIRNSMESEETQKTCKTLGFRANSAIVFQAFTFGSARGFCFSSAELD